MDAAFVFRQGLGSVIPRPSQHSFYPRKPPIPPPRPRDNPDSHAPHRIAHTLTACCRCRQRKTRCDAALPRCLPCERAGSTCEYFDTARGEKINRNYVIKLQEKVRQLEDELKQSTEDDGKLALDAAMHPGGLVRLNGTDETPRYLGPGSGITMTRFLMDEAKRFTESKTIADAFPEVLRRRHDRANRMQSVVGSSGSISGPSGRKKSYPMISDVPAEGLPSKAIAEGLLAVYNQRAQIFTPLLHEKILEADFEAVFAGDNDPYKNFVVRMVTAISLQKMDPGWAGLADSYYLAAMNYFQEVVRPKDLKTLQCLALTAQYSLLTPARTAVYFIVGLAVRICQQMGICEEKTIALGVSDPQTLDMRRRLSWVVATNELGLAHIMGRPNGFSKSNDVIDVEFFETAYDENITPEGIKPGPVCENKAVAIHFCKMRLLQAEIRRMLYEKKRPEPANEDHVWFSQMKQKMDEWLESSPEKPEWSKPWFTGRYHSMMVMLYRPSPQIPKPTGNAALKCFEGAHYIINLGSEQVKRKAIDITWVFLLTVYLSLNALLWSVSYAEVRDKHPREEFEELLQTAIEIVELCSERWPGALSAAQLYSLFSKACLQSYEQREETPAPPMNAGRNVLGTPKSLADTSSPDSDSTATPLSQQGHSQPPIHFTPPFGYVFGATSEEMSSHYSYSFDTSPPPFSGPAFRSNSIFHNPTADSYGRRGSYFPPDFTSPDDQSLQEQSDESTPPGTALSDGHLSPMNGPMAEMLPTPPESLAPPSADPSNYGLSPRLQASGPRTASPTPTPTMRRASPVPLSLQPSPVPPPSLKFEHVDYTPVQTKQQEMPPPRAPLFTIPQQRGAPTPVHNWGDVPMPLISPHAFSSGINPGFWSDGAALTPFAGLGLGNESYSIGGRGGSSAGMHGPLDGDFPMFSGPSFPTEYQFLQRRHGSLSQEQQLELSSVLETEGMTDIDSFLSAGMGLGGGGIDNGVRWG